MFCFSLDQRPTAAFACPVSLCTLKTQLRTLMSGFSLRVSAVSKCWVKAVPNFQYSLGSTFQNSREQTDVMFPSADQKAKKIPWCSISLISAKIMGYAFASKSSISSEYNFSNHMSCPMCLLKLLPHLACVLLLCALKRTMHKSMSGLCPASSFPNPRSLFWNQLLKTNKRLKMFFFSLCGSKDITRYWHVRIFCEHSKQETHVRCLVSLCGFKIWPVRFHICAPSARSK
jgi:hypothetical protein